MTLTTRLQQGCLPDVGGKNISIYVRVNKTIWSTSRTFGHQHGVSCGGNTALWGPGPTADGPMC